MVSFVLLLGLNRGISFLQYCLLFLLTCMVLKLVQWSHTSSMQIMLFFFFCYHVNETEARNLFDVINLFLQMVETIGQLRKISNPLQSKVVLADKEKRYRILNIVECNYHSSYLGNPFCKPPSKRLAFNGVIEKLKSKLSGQRGLSSKVSWSQVHNTRCSRFSNRRISQYKLIRWFEISFGDSRRMMVKIFILD